MPLRVNIEPTKGKGQGKYRAILQPGSRISFDEFLDSAVEGTTLSRADIMAVTSCINRWIVNWAGRGREVDLGPLGRSRLGVRGSFDKPPQELNAGDLELSLGWIFTTEIREQIRGVGRKATLEKVGPKTQLPSVDAVRAFDSQDSEWKLSCWKAGSTLHLEGDRLKFDRRRKDEGLFYKPFSAKGSTKWKRLDTYLNVFPKNVYVLIPEELAGLGNLKICIRRRVRPTMEYPLDVTCPEKLRELP